MDCCGAKLETPFCPFCGKAADDPLQGLLAYVHTQRTRALNLQGQRHDNDAPSRHLRSSDKSVKRWSDWETALRDAIHELEVFRQREAERANEKGTEPRG